jgi:hypothetical protein
MSNNKIKLRAKALFKRHLVRQNNAYAGAIIVVLYCQTANIGKCAGLGIANLEQI